MVEEDMVWFEIERLPSPNRKVVDVRKLSRSRRELILKIASATNEQDNYEILSAIKQRLDRMTLLLGPPSSGKSTLLKALAGKLESNLKKSGDITYNGHTLDEFCVQTSSAYISQTDDHIAELTVRETLDYAAQFQGASDGFAGFMEDLARLEKEKGIRPSPEIDAFMKISSQAYSVGGVEHSLATEYILMVLGLEACADTIVGNDMIRGVSGGQRKRLTTGEMIVGPRKTLFMDEISTGLDSSTTYQIVKCMRNFVHLMEGTVLMALLQPAPETFDLFDDIILLSEGHMVYQGPRENVVEFFESLGFKLPPRKGIADFLQEVTSKKDQAQYWVDNSRPYEFLSSHPSSLSKDKFAVSKWELFKTCFAREALLMKRNSFVYAFRACQVAAVAFVTCTMFLHTRFNHTDVANGNLDLACLFLGLMHITFNGYSELSIMIYRLPVFYKQRDNHFHPAWAWSIPNWIMRVPYSALEAIVWSCVVYYTVGFGPEAGRFFRFMFLLFTMHLMALSLFQLMAAIVRNMVIANTVCSACLLILFLMGGFVLPKAMVKPWWIWAYWVSPFTYAQLALSVNEFSSNRWMKKSVLGGDTLGHSILRSHSLPTRNYWYWLGVGVLIAYAILFNSLVTLALAYLNPLKKAQPVVPLDMEEDDGIAVGDKPPESVKTEVSQKGMILSFEPLSMTFHNVSYFVDMPKEMVDSSGKRLQLLSNVSGVFSPGVLTALVGTSGAGKTTLMDVLAGRKTGGYIEGDIRISGHPKEQKTFARISGYVEQNDIHSPQLTVEESLLFSSRLRLPKDIDTASKNEFVEEVMRLVELDTLRNALVGLPGSSGLSTEQRKRLTIAVELVANPSIIFMDEPTSGLDARAAAIVMRTVRNTVDTGRTVVCTIHQPSIDIFEAFDELLLMKLGGQLIYGGKLGLHSQIMIDYFQMIDGIPPIADGYNPAAWVLEVTSKAFEERVGQDFADIYRNSNQFRDTPQDLSAIMGALFASCLFLGVSNAASVQPVISIERTVYYREKAAGMYSSFSYAAAQGLIEIPYIALQSILYCVITFFMMDYERTIAMLAFFSYFTFYGIMAVGLTPNVHVAAIVSSAFYSVWNLLSGFFIPIPKIPGWWIWFYYICPLSWSLRGIITSQLGDLEDHIEGPDFNGTIKEYIEENLGYKSGMVGVSAVVLIAFSVLFFTVYGISIRSLTSKRDEIQCC
ncbi:hypothetical protein Syun_008461 [Stephania yunnanensis]|uniref:ABC transporter domain-containing protein n=1 Tax=Stephania yunnanensis TaxID=152371 RepID=A0AAP0KF79_9MAGN